MASSNTNTPAAQLHSDGSPLNIFEDSRIKTAEPSPIHATHSVISHNRGDGHLYSDRGSTGEWELPLNSSFSEDFHPPDVLAYCEDSTARLAALRAGQETYEAAAAAKRTPGKDFVGGAPKRINSGGLQQSEGSAAALAHPSLTGTEAPRQLVEAEQDDLMSPEHRELPDLSAGMILPARKLFAIQMGDKLFRLSGASISSDAPSYLSQFFKEQMKNNQGSESCRPLYIDRDPATFGDIMLHLQGYHIEPRDGPHFVKLFADAQFFSLPRLTAQLFSSTIYVRIGEQEFSIPKALLNNPGDSPNYFSLGFSNFFTTPNDRFPGLSQRELLRPPSLPPPSVPTRSAEVFADLLHLLQGYHIHIRDEHHRHQLLRDARYYHFKGLEQRLIAHQIAYNVRRHKTEIMLRLEDIQPSGLTVVLGDVDVFTPSTSPGSALQCDASPSSGSIYYRRPYVDAEAYELVVETGEEDSTVLEVKPACIPTATFRLAHASFHNNQTLTRVTRLVAAVSEKINLSRAQSTDAMNVDDTGKRSSSSPHSASASDRRIPVRIGSETHIVLDGLAWTPNLIVSGEPNVDDTRAKSPSARLRGHDERDNGGLGAAEWVVGRAQWRLTVQLVQGTARSDQVEAEVVLEAVKMEAFSSERSRNAARSFLA